MATGANIVDLFALNVCKNFINIKKIIQKNDKEILGHFINKQIFFPDYLLK